MIPPYLVERLLFIPTREDPGSPPVLQGVPGSDIVLTGLDGTRIHGWWYEAPRISPSPAPRLLLLHGNAGHIGHRIGLAEGFSGGSPCSFSSIEVTGGARENPARRD